MVCLSASKFDYVSIRSPKRPFEDHSVTVFSYGGRLYWSFCRRFRVLFVILSPFALLYPLWGIQFVIVFLVIYGFLSKLMSKTISQESVLIKRGFGVQLQTQYHKGKEIRRFIPIDQILKPVLVERVTPVTCYWSLSLVVRDEDELTPVFQTRPPLKILVHIWKALCEATNKEESSNTFTFKLDGQLE